MVTMATARGLSVRIIAFAAFSATCYFGATVIITVVLAILTAYLLDPFVNLLHRIKVPRGLAIAFSMAVAGLIIASLFSLLVETTQQFSESLPKYATRIQRISNDIWNRVRAIEKRSEDIGKTIMPKATREPQAVQIQQPSTWHGLFFRDLGPIYDYLIQITFFPFLVYFLLGEKDRIRAFISQLVRSRTSLSTTLVIDTSDKIVNDLNRKIRGFILGTLLSTGIVFFVAWMLFLSFGVEGAVIWAFLFSLLSYPLSSLLSTLSRISIVATLRVVSAAAELRYG